MATEITDANFNETINSGKLVLVDFWAGWCGPCKAIAPLIEQISKDYHNRAIIGKMDVDKNKATPPQFGIRGIPALLLFKNGKLIDRMPVGFNKATLEAKLNQYL